MTTESSQAIPSESEALLASRFSIVERAPLPMAMVAGVDHLVLYVNPAFCFLLGKSQNELEGRPFSEMVPKHDKCIGLLDRVFRSGMPASHMEEQHSAMHPLFWSYTLWPVMSDRFPEGVMFQVTESATLHEKTLAMNEALILGSLRQHELTEASDSSNRILEIEIGERKQAEAALEQAQTQLSDRAGQLEGLVIERTTELRATNSQLESFVYSIAHDLRAPLRGMQGYSALLREEAGDVLNQTARDYVDRINRSAQFMDAMLIDLLAFSRVSQQRLVLTSVNLGAVAASVVSSFQNEIGEKNATVSSSEPRLNVLAHEATLTQVIFNLMSNALKFVNSDAPPVIRLRIEEKGDFTRFWVEDNGIGIAPDHQSQIFRLFLRLEGEKYEGTGIGLAIVQKGIERMGGRVGVESILGTGSRFWFELRTAS